MRCEVAPDLLTCRMWPCSTMKAKDLEFQLMASILKYICIVYARKRMTALQKA